MLISVLTISYNSAGSISETIKSVNEQIYPHIQHVFVDGASSDNTLDIINSKSTRSNVVVSERDTGIYQALNKGIHRCKGEYIVVLHSDDAFHSKYVLESIVEKLRSHGFPDLLSGSVVHVNKFNQANGAVVYKSERYKRLFLGFGFIPAHNATFVKRDLYKYRLYDESFISAGDYEWFIRVLSDPKISFRTTPIVVSQQLRGGTSSAGIKSYWRSTIEQKRALKLNGKNVPLFLLLCRLPIKFLWRKFHLMFCTRRLLNMGLSK